MGDLGFSWIAAYRDSTNGHKTAGNDYLMKSHNNDLHSNFESSVKFFL